jgi:hypothetical protein
VQDAEGTEEVTEAHERRGAVAVPAVEAQPQRIEQRTRQLQQIEVAVILVPKHPAGVAGAELAAASHQLDAERAAGIEAQDGVRRHIRHARPPVAERRAAERRIEQATQVAQEERVDVGVEPAMLVQHHQPERVGALRGRRGLGQLQLPGERSVPRQRLRFVTEDAHVGRPVPQAALVCRAAVEPQPRFQPIEVLRDQERLQCEDRLASQRARQ